MNANTYPTRLQQKESVMLLRGYWRKTGFTTSHWGCVALLIRVTRKVTLRANGNIRVAFHEKGWIEKFLPYVEFTGMDTLLLDSLVWVAPWWINFEEQKTAFWLNDRWSINNIHSSFTIEDLFGRFRELETPFERRNLSLICTKILSLPLLNIKSPSFWRHFFFLHSEKYTRLLSVVIFFLIATVLLSRATEQKFRISRIVSFFLCLWNLNLSPGII